MKITPRFWIILSPTIYRTLGFLAISCQLCSPFPLLLPSFLLNLFFSPKKTPSYHHVFILCVWLTDLVRDACM